MLLPPNGVPPSSSSSSLRRLSHPCSAEWTPAAHNMTAGPCPRPQPPGHTQATSKGPLHTRHRHRALLAPPSLPITTVGAVQLRQVLHFRKAPRCTLSCHLLELLVGWLFVSPILTSPYTTSFCSSPANHQGSIGCPSPLPT